LKSEEAREAKIEKGNGFDIFLTVNRSETEEEEGEWSQPNSCVLVLVLEFGSALAINSPTSFRQSHNHVHPLPLYFNPDRLTQLNRINPFTFTCNLYQLQIHPTWFFFLIS